MNQIIEIKDHTPVVSHRVVAEHSQVKQRSVRMLIDKHFEDFEEFGGVSFEMTTLQTAGGPQEAKTYYLNEPQATLLMTYLQNTQPVKVFKKALVKGFYELRAQKEQEALPMTAVMSLLAQVAENMGLMAQAQNKMIQRLDKLEANNSPQYHDNIIPLYLPKAPEHFPMFVANRHRSKKWNKQETIALVQLHAEGVGSAQIGATLGKSASAVRQRLHRIFSAEV